MGLFDFRRNKNIKNDNGLNEVYFEHGKSKQLHERFYKVNGKFDGLKESFYEWDKNAGYGTKNHLNAITSMGISKFHRKTYQPISKLITKLST